MNNKNHSSGDGERRAQIGYYPQYCIAADKIYQGLLEGTFRSVSIADPTVGRVDDILIVSTGHVDAYQVKWSEHQGFISFKEFINGSTGADSLFGKLAHGWKSVSEKYQGIDAFVHLIEYNLANNNKNAKVEIEDCLFEGTFSEFVTLWNKKTLLNKKTNKLINKISEYLCLDYNLFIEFYNLSFFHFGYTNPFEIPYDQISKKEDHLALFHLIQQCAGGQMRVINLSKDELIDRLNWTNRFKMQFSHEFPRPFKYEPIQTTIIELEKILNNNNSGYIALTGTPGSGKSTTLSQYFIENKSFCYIPYFAYIPDSYYTGIRGESFSFFADITKELEHWGFKGKIGVIPHNLEELKKKFGQQLQEAHEKYEKENIKTIILIDGLDHIVREQNPHISLLRELPHPENIPTGIIIVLGTQTLHLKDLLPAINNQLKKDNRTIIIKSLTKLQTFNLLKKYDIYQLQDNEKERVYQKTTGHPLFLTYTIQLIKEKRSIDALDQYENYVDTIENMYISSWEQIKTNQKIIDILAIISRFRLPFEPENFLSFAERQDLILFIEKFSHYFKRGKVWSFYHNSFKQFLLQKTKETPFDNYNEEQDKEYYKRLSNILLETSNEIAHWELIYTLFHAEEEQKILELATQSYFRKQYLKLRPYNEIKNDISILLQISKNELDFKILLRCLLIEKELLDREQILEEVDIISLLYDTYGVSAILNLIYNPINNYDIIEYFKMALYLYQNGYIEEAKTIYEQYIPLNYLSGNVSYTYNYHEKETLLDSWIEIALLFQSISEIIEYIENTKIDKNNLFGHDEINNEVLHIHLIDVLAKEILCLNQQNKIINFIEICKSKNEYSYIVFQMCLKISKRKLFRDDIEFHKNIYLFVDKYIKEYTFHPNDQLKIAEFFLNNKNFEKSINLVKNLKQITINEINDNYDHSWFYKTIQLNRLLAEHNILEQPQNIIPDSNDYHHFGTVQYLRCLVIFSQFEGIINRGGKIGIYDFKKYVEYTIRILQKPFNETREWYSWYMLEKTFSEFYKYIIIVGSKINNDCIETLEEIFIESWNSDIYWLLDTKRIIIEELLQHGANRKKLLPVLDGLFEIIKNQLDANNRVSTYIDFINTFKKLNIEKDFPSLFHDLLQGSFAIHDRKDYQIHDWMFWLELFTKKHSEKVSNDLDKFLNSLSVLYHEKGGDNAEAIQKLLQIVASINPNRSFSMLKWLLDKGTCNYTKSLTGFLSGILSFDSSLYIECLLLYQKLIIPFEPDSPSNIIELFIDLLYKNYNHDIFNEYLDPFIQAINTDLVSISRKEWLTCIKSALLKFNSENSIIIKTIENYIYKIPEKKILEDTRIKYIRKDFKSFTELYLYLAENNDKEHLDMNYIVMNIINTITENDIEMIKLLIKNDTFKIDEIIVICKTIEKLFSINISEELLEISLNAIEKNGWSTQWNRAPRLQLYKELIRINNNKWKKLAFDDFVNTYLSINRYPYYYIYDWENINIAFNNNLECFIEGYWDEITQHIYELIDFKNINEMPKYIINDDSNLLLIIRIALYFLKLPVPVFQIKSHQFLVEIIGRNIEKDEVYNILDNYLDLDGLIVNKILLILDCLCKNHINFINKFTNKLLLLSVDSDISIRFQAINILSEIKITPLPKKYKPLSSLYYIIFDEEDNPFGNKDVDPYGVLPDPISIRDFVRVFDTDINLLSKMTGINKINITMRIMSIIEQLEPENMWNKEAEKKIRKWLEDINQNYMYHRPRPQIVKRALNIVIGELIDANKLPNERMSDIYFLTAKRVNKYLSLIKPISIPDMFINNQFVNEWKDNIHKEPKKWIENINLDMHKLFSKYDEKIIIGAYTVFSYFDWSKPTETNISCIYLEEIGEGNEDNIDLLLKINTLIFYSSDIYPKPYNDMPKSLTIYCNETYIDHCGISWFGFNPEIALQLKWKFIKSEGLFKWIDLNGNIMVESLYFRDGSIKLYPPKNDLFCSEGWIVIASEDAIKQIRSKFNSLYKISYSKRTYIEEKNEYENSLHQIIKVTEADGFIM